MFGSASLPVVRDPVLRSILDDSFLRGTLDSFFKLPRNNLESVRNWKMMEYIREEDGVYKLEVEVPGMNKDDISIEIKGSVVTIKGESTKRNVKFTNSYPLLETIDIKRITAKVEDGILEILMPKVAEKKPLQIKVQ
jgi:HSP20 family protein